MSGLGYAELGEIAKELGVYLGDTASRSTHQTFHVFAISNWGRIGDVKARQAHFTEEELRKKIKKLLAKNSKPKRIHKRTS